VAELVEAQGPRCTLNVEQSFQLSAVGFIYIYIWNGLKPFRTTCTPLEGVARSDGGGNFFADAIMLLAPANYSVLLPACSGNTPYGFIEPLTVGANLCVRPIIPFYSFHIVFGQTHRSAPTESLQTRNCSKLRFPQ